MPMPTPKLMQDDNDARGTVTFQNFQQEKIEKFGHVT